MSSLSDKVWYTYKARIRASERLQRNNFHSQLLLVWYALISSALAIAAIRYPNLAGEDTDIFSAVLSVALLAISLLVTNSDFRGRAMQMQRNYLALQNLHIRLTFPNSAITVTDTDEYIKLLNGENHLSIDDKYWRVFTSDKITRPVSPADKASTFFYLIVRFFFLLALYVGPISLFLFINSCL